MDNPMAFMLFFSLTVIIGSSLWVLLAPQNVYRYGEIAFFAGTAVFVVWALLVVAIIAFSSVVVK